MRWSWARAKKKAKQDTGLTVTGLAAQSEFCAQGLANVQHSTNAQRPTNAHQIFLIAARIGLGGDRILWILAGEQ